MAFFNEIGLISQPRHISFKNCFASLMNLGTCLVVVAKKVISRTTEQDKSLFSDYLQSQRRIGRR